MNTTKKTTKFAALAIIPLALALVTGCTAAGGASAESTPKKTMSADDWNQAFQKCLRDNGIEAESKDGAIGVEEGGDRDAMMKAMDACQKKIGPAPGSESGPSKEKREEKLLKMTKCLRENGIDVDDPKDGGISIPANIPEEISEKCTG